MIYGVALIFNCIYTEVEMILVAIKPPSLNDLKLYYDMKPFLPLDV